MAEEKKSRKPERIATLDNSPDAINQIDTEYIIAYCKKHNEVKWLKEVASKTYTGKDDKKRRYGLFQIRKEFVEKFMPDLHKPNSNKPSLYDRIAAL